MIQNQKVQMDQKGFTLVEIIAVLVILGILAAVAVPKFFDMQETAEKKTLLTAFNDMQSRMNSQFGKSMLDNNGVALVADFNDFADLGLDSPALNQIYKDFPGTWSYAAALITYTAKNGGVVYSFTINSAAADGATPAIINVSPALK